MSSEPVMARRRGAVTVPGPLTIDSRDVVIGRDVLELVSSAMYVDPITIYREYVQNAADAVDEARRHGMLAADEPGRVDIEINPSTRSVRVRDNGAGIAAADFVRR